MIAVQVLLSSNRDEDLSLLYGFLPIKSWSAVKRADIALQRRIDNEKVIHRRGVRQNPAQQGSGWPHLLLHSVVHALTGTAVHWAE